jgi:hypothetical protein
MKPSRLSRAWTVWLALVVAVGMFIPHAHAEDIRTMVTRNGNDVIRLQNRPCVHAGTLSRIKPDWRDKFRHGRALVEGKDFFLCWIVHGDAVFVLYEDGDQGLIPLTDFKPDEGI